MSRDLRSWVGWVTANKQFFKCSLTFPVIAICINAHQLLNNRPYFSHISYITGLFQLFVFFVFCISYSKDELEVFWLVYTGPFTSTQLSEIFWAFDVFSLWNFSIAFLQPQDNELLYREVLRLASSVIN